LKIKKREVIKLLGLIGIFLGSVAVCFVLFLGFIISRCRCNLNRSGIKIGDIMPYIIIFSFVVAFVVLISVLIEDKKSRKGKTTRKKRN